jgi:replication factor A2
MNAEGSKHAEIKEGDYIRVWGRIKSFNDKRHVGALFVRPVVDPMEVQMHLLEATYVHLYFTRGPPESIQSGANGGDNNSMFVDQGAGVKQNYNPGGAQLPNLTTTARKVYNMLQNAPQNNEGLNVAMLASQLGMQQADVYKAGDELLGLGIIYTTVDDETWAVLEN